MIISTELQTETKLAEVCPKAAATRLLKDPCCKTKILLPLTNTRSVIQDQAAALINGRRVHEANPHGTFLVLHGTASALQPSLAARHTEKSNCASSMRTHRQIAFIS